MGSTGGGGTIWISCLDILFDLDKEERHDIETFGKQPKTAVACKKFF